MKPTFVGIAAVTALLTTGAFAADLPMQYTRAPLYAAPIFNWTGFYVGGNIGYSWGRSSETSVLTNSAGTALFTDAGTSSLNGIVGGGQVGYNWQISNFVWGIEADIQGTDEKGGPAFVCPAGVCVPAGSLSVVPITMSQKIDWFGTLRGRAGVAVTPAVLLYATGGFAYGEVDTSEVIGAVPVAFSKTTINPGWTAGAGIEGAIGGGWTARLEYLYVDLGKVNGTFVTPIPAFGTGVIVNNLSTHVTDNIVRAGINYKFNGPVVARY